MGPKLGPPPNPHVPWGLGLCKGGPGRLSLPDPSPLVSVPFSCQSIMQTEGRRGEEGVWVGEISLQGGSQPGLGPGLGPGLQGRQQAPSLSPPPCSAESWGPGAEQRGWGGLIGSPAPGGSRAPRPARGAAGLCSARLSSPPVPESPGRECLVPAAPSPGPEGRAGRRPTLCSPPPPRPGASRSRSPKEPSHRATVAAPDSQPPTPGWQGREHGKASRAGSAHRHPLVALPLACRTRPWARGWTLLCLPGSPTGRTTLPPSLDRIPRGPLQPPPSTLSFSPFPPPYPALYIASSRLLPNLVSDF